MNYEWSTPQEFFDGLDGQFRFTLDVCASPRNTKCNRYYTKKDDALKRCWRGRCWCNPPYDRRIGKWVKKAYEASLKGNLVVCLLPAHTDTNWYHDYACKGEVVFIRGRLRFSGKGRAPFPSMIVVFHPQKSWSPSASSD